MTNRRLRVCVLVLTAIVGGCVVGGPSDPPSEMTPPLPNASGVGAQPESLTAPLPVPLIRPDGSADEVAATLAGQLLAGGPQTLPALLGALGAAGVTVHGPEGEAVVEPPDGQGVALSAWEVRLMARLVDEGEVVTVPLDTIEDVLVQAVPEMTGEPIGQYILDGIRAHAQADDGHMGVWARLIVELGRQRAGDDAQDLLAAQVEPDAVQLDVVQLSLISLRLAGDLAAVEGLPSGTRVDQADGMWFVPVARAAGPCASEGPAVVDAGNVTASGFDVLKAKFREYLGKSLGRAGQAVRDYRTLVLVLAALRIEVWMDATPLVRTRSTDSFGEGRTLHATVKLDPGVLGTVECARALLAALGLRFNVGQPESGGIGGVPLEFSVVPWDSELVMLEEDPAHWQSSRRDVTDSEGNAEARVVGRPQPTDVGASPEQDSKQSAVAVAFDLRPYTLLGGEAPGGVAIVPPEFLLGLSYRYVASYPFEVIDWAPAGQWTGSITIEEKTQSVVSSEGEKGGNHEETDETLRVVVQLAETEQDNSSVEGALAIVKAQISGEYSLAGSGTGWGKTYCGTLREVRLDGSNEEQMTGSAAGDARVMITLLPTGTYAISVDSEVELVATGERTEQAEKCEGSNGTWSVVSRSSTTPLGPTSWGLGGYVITGEIDPQHPDVLSGTVTDGPTSPEYSKVTTITWNIERP